VSSASLLAVASCSRSTAARDTASVRLQGAATMNGCGDLPSSADLTRFLRMAPDSGGDAGGLFHGRAEWGAIVNRSGQVCVLVAPGDSVGGFWPGSRSISMAKAFTANGFSTDGSPLSTARLYTLAQPGHSLWGVTQPEPFDAQCYGASVESKVCGGAITFGGGVPLYRNARIVGGLGVSGDTPCSDHEIAKRVRRLAGLEPKGGAGADDIQYTKTDKASVFTHPLCPNTWRNGHKIGDEAPASGY
ncbi:MAG: GlcG/HbpS family heme-binding protein, partial [bacterium]